MGERIASIWRRYRKAVISAFIIYHCAAIAFWLMPKGPLRRHVLPLFTTYINIASLWQFWSVFAPEPKKYNIFLTSLIQYDDGSTKYWPLPRPDKMDYITRAFKERYRKWASEGLWTKGNEAIYPDACRWVARQNLEPGKSPKRVTLIRTWEWIPPPETGIGQPVPEATKPSPFYTEEIKPEDLK